MSFMQKDSYAIQRATRKINELELDISKIFLDPNDPLYMYNKNKYNHKMERIEAYKRVLNGTDSESDFFLFYIHIMIWREKDKSDPYYKERTDPTNPIYTLSQEIYNKEVESLTYYGEHDLKEYFQECLNHDMVYIMKKYNVTNIF